jgi:biotin carboxyl carrier protein
MKYVTIINDKKFEVEILPDGSLMVNGKHHTVDFLAFESDRYSIIKDNHSLELVIEKNDDGYDILLGGRRYTGMVLDERALLMVNRKGGLGGSGGEIKSPMPGLIVAVTANVGDEVREGQTLVILESMKMQNELKSPRAGIVENINVKQGQTVEKGASLVTVGEKKE